MTELRDEAIALYNQAIALENSDSTGDVSAQVVELLTLAQNTCPHELSQTRRTDLDVDGIQVYECPDCHNLNYIQT